ncbi:MAG TPA: ABC transporter permease [Casimicrobiaceae bacterium]|nr:ABC transporter permease [Casimicrobiaceae bacterium]
MNSAASHGPRRVAPALLYGTLTLAALLCAWMLATSALGLVDARVLPSPAGVLARAATLIATPFSGATLAGHALASLHRWIIGVACAIAIGIPVGVLLAWLPPVRAAVAPLFELLRFIPPFAWVPIAVLWFGASTTTQALVVFIAAFPACVINAQLGVSQVDPILPRAAKALGAGSLATLLRVVMPVAAPSAFTGVRIAVSNGWMALVGAELIVGKQGLGFLISQGQNNDSVATIFVGIIAIGVLGALIDVVLQRAQARMLPWTPPVAEGL